MNRCELVDVDLGVNLGCGDVGVAQHLLHIPDVGSAFKHQGGHGVTEQVACTLLRNAGSFDMVTG